MMSTNNTSGKNEDIYRVMYLPVRVGAAEYASSEEQTGSSMDKPLYVVYGNDENSGGSVVVNASLLRTAEDVVSKSGLKTDIESAACKRYSEALNAFVRKDGDADMEIWGCATFAEALEMDPSEFIKKWECHKYLMRAGEIWKGRDNKSTVVILPLLDSDKNHGGHVVRFMHTDGTRDVMPYGIFVQRFYYTNKISKHLMPLIEELNALQGE